MNTFIEFPSYPTEENFSRLKHNIKRTYTASHQDFENFARFLGKRTVTKEELTCFISGLWSYVTCDEGGEDSDLAIIQYGSRCLFIHIEKESHGPSNTAYYVNGTNTLPEEVFEGTGIRYWGGEE
jgi:hypothetical protein